MKSRTEAGNPQPAAKLTVLLGVYRKGILGYTERYADLKEANLAGRDWERMGYQVIIRCGVSSLPDEYPYEVSE